MTDTNPSSNQRVWIALKGNKESLRLAESDGWEVHEVAKAPACSPNSPEDIRQSMNLLQQIHRDAKRCDVHDYLLPDGNCNCHRTASPVETSGQDMALMRAAGWLAAPEGESRQETVNLIRALVARVKNLTPVEQPYLCEATRFKLGFDSKGRVNCFSNFARQLDGRWVALVGAEDDAHLRPAVEPSPDQLVGALQDRVHNEIGVTRPAHAVKASGDVSKMRWDACSEGGLWVCQVCDEAYASPPWSRIDAAKDHINKCRGRREPL